MVKRKRDPTDTEQYFKKKRNSDVRHLTDKSKLALGKATDFHDVEAEINQVLAGCIVGDDDPACLFVWNIDLLSLCVTSANAQGVMQPYWITTAPGTMSITTLINDICGLLATVAGGRTGYVLLAPNNLSQYSNIISILRDIESSAFMQNAAAALPVGAILASTYQLQDKVVASAVPCNRPPPINPTFRQLFT